MLDVGTTGKGLLIFLMLVMTVAVNVGDNAMARLGFDQDYLIIGLFATVVTGLIMHRNLFLVILVLLLSIGANMPVDFMLNFGWDRDYFIGALGAIVFAPLLVKIME